MAFLLDANVLIEAKKRYYAFDICPGFWGWVDEQTQAGTVVSVEAVRDELLAGGDELTDWVRARPSLFPAIDAAVLPHLQTLTVWTRAQRYRPAAVADFLNSADYYLIATAMGHSHTVVTHETPSDAIKRVKIPEPCIAHNVPVVTPFVMLRRLGARFVLPQP